MTRNEFGTVLGLSGLAITVASTWYLAKVAKIPWFAERFGTNDRWLNVQGMLPIAIPVYVFIALLMRTIPA